MTPGVKYWQKNWYMSFPEIQDLYWGCRCHQLSTWTVPREMKCIPHSLSYILWILHDINALILCLELWLIRDSSLENFSDDKTADNTAFDTWLLSKSISMYGSKSSHGPRESWSDSSSQDLRYQVQTIHSNTSMRNSARIHQFSLSPIHKQVFR